MKFNMFDKYTLETLLKKLNKLESFYKETIKTDYINMNKLFNESKTVSSEEASVLIENKDSFVVGVNFFDTKKTDFYLVSNENITIPITKKDKLIIDNPIELEKELKELGFFNAMSLELKSKKDIFSNDSLLKKYGIKKNQDTQDLQKVINELCGLRTSIKNNSYYKQLDIKEKDFYYLLSQSNNITRKLFDNINMHILPHDEILDDLKENGFMNMRIINDFKESIKNILSFLDLNLDNSKLYEKINTSTLEMESIPYEKSKEINTDFLKISFDEKKIMDILKKENLTSVYVKKHSEIRIGKPIATREEYEEFLNIEEYIKKANYAKDIELNIQKLLTLDEVFEKEFHMK